MKFSTDMPTFEHFPSCQVIGSCWDLSRFLKYLGCKKNYLKKFNTINFMLAGISILSVAINNAKVPVKAEISTTKWSIWQKYNQVFSNTDATNI
jgi:hypothetical protein